ncbi:unnamed protein product [Lactuca virosa]|uniref:Leucine-rich repeat-containing N-terminal plant-type domain-containing protein n=1 Tax=Lactuca virosa TaxID=75947 RepID=A0AAU9LRC5_9ASTR|nr:unnamed protein product [Lactuca virosa]
MSGLQSPISWVVAYKFTIFILFQLLQLARHHIGPLPVSHFHLANLEVADLSSNKFNRVLPVHINLPALQVLDLSDNVLRGFLPSDLCVNSTRIRLLRFALNYFNETIPPQFRNCTFLQHLDVACNSISGIMPDFLFRLPNLQELALQDNMFTAIGGIAFRI